MRYVNLQDDRDWIGIEQDGTEREVFLVDTTTMTACTKITHKEGIVRREFKEFRVAEKSEL